MEKIAKLPNPRPQSVQCPCPISGNLHNAQCPGSCALCLVPCVLVPCVLCTVSCVLCLLACVLGPVSFCFLCPVSCVFCPWSCVLLFCVLFAYATPRMVIKSPKVVSMVWAIATGYASQQTPVGSTVEGQNFATKNHVYLTSRCWSSPFSPISMLQGSTGPGNSKSMLIAACRDKTTKSFLQH